MSDDVFDFQIEKLGGGLTKKEPIKRIPFNYRIYMSDMSDRDSIIFFNTYELQKPNYNNNSIFEDGIEELKKEFGTLDKYQNLPKPHSKKNINGEESKSSSGGLKNEDIDFYNRYLNFKQDTLQNRYYFSADVLRDIIKILKKKYNIKENQL